MAVQALLFGIDKLEGSFEIPGYKERAKELLRELLALKEQAQVERRTPPYQLGSRQFLVQAKGRQFYELTLKHPDFILWLTDYERDGTPPVLVSISSEYLWAVGPLKAVRAVYTTLRLAGLDPAGNKCSRVDVMLDYCGRRLNFADLYDIVCTSRKRMPLDENFLAPEEYLGYVGTKQRDKGLSAEQGLDVRLYAVQRQGHTELTGLVVALAQPLSWRGYNKVLEIERVSGKRWFFDIWRENGWTENEDGELPVVFRSEFQIRREAITDMAPILGEKLDTFEDIINHMPDMWRYLTGEWLQFKHKRATKNVTRAPVRKWWRHLQRPEIGVDWETINPVERLGRLRKAKRQILDSMIAGCLAGVSAHQGTAGDLTRTVQVWVDQLGQVVAPDGDLTKYLEGWGIKSRQRAMNYLLADLKHRLKTELRKEPTQLADLATVIGRWSTELEPESVAKFKIRSNEARGLINHGQGELLDAEG